MNAEPRANHPFTIAHATDLLPEGGVAFMHGVALARATQGTLVSVHAHVPGKAVRPMPTAVDLLARWRSDDPVDHKVMEHTCCDDPVDTLLDALRRVDPDLLVVGTSRPTGVNRVFRGSVSESLALNAHLPTLFVPMGETGFVDPVDGTLTLRHALVPARTQRDASLGAAMLEELVERAGLTDVQAVLLHVGDDDVAESLMAPESDAVAWSVEQRTGNVVDAIIACADEHHVDLLVMSTDGHNSLLDALRGSHTERVVRAAHCAVLAVPAGIA